jgi:polyhydroxyalkanoate synthase
MPESPKKPSRRAEPRQGDADQPEVAVQAAEALAPEGAMVGDMDSLDLAGTLGRAALAAAGRPFEVVSAGVSFGTRLAQAAAQTAISAAGMEAPPVVEPARGDRRFTDPTWRENPLFSWYLQRYLLFGELVDSLVEVAGLQGTDAGKLRLVADLTKAAASPTNQLLSNPAALKRAFETGGRSLARGLRNFMDDARNNGGWPRQVDTRPFTVGGNLAATPGKVVYRNELMELLQFEPQTAKVHATPILCSPPWINKYYVMDLAPGKSFVEWAVQHGHTVFAISYRNPDASMASTTLEDYLVHGPRAAIDVIRGITGQERVNVVAVCLGGTLATMLLAYLAAVDDDTVGAVTLLNTLVDFSQPGALGAFTDRSTVERLEQRLQREGVLPASQMARTFDLLRPDDLVFNYVARNWLMGEDPPAFDMLAWNADSTNMPAAMHSFYLRACYLENRLARGELVLCDRELDLSRITADAFVVGAVNDHIVPWRASYRTTQLLPKSDMTYVLSSAGHIAGIINPPGPKATSWTRSDYPDDADAWHAGTTELKRSWWELWAEWADDDNRSGAMVAPPSLGSKEYPVLGDAPGTYVHG